MSKQLEIDFNDVDNDFNCLLCEYHSGQLNKNQFANKVMDMLTYYKSVKLIGHEIYVKYCHRLADELDKPIMRKACVCELRG